jgi:hypothetical protein
LTPEPWSIPVGSRVRRVLCIVFHDNVLRIRDIIQGVLVVVVVVVVVVVIGIGIVDQLVVIGSSQSVFDGQALFESGVELAPAPDAPKLIELVLEGVTSRCPDSFQVSVLVVAAGLCCQLPPLRRQTGLLLDDEAYDLISSGLGKV